MNGARVIALRSDLFRFAFFLFFFSLFRVCVFYLSLELANNEMCVCVDATLRTKCANRLRLIILHMVHQLYRHLELCCLFCFRAAFRNFHENVRFGHTHTQQQKSDRYLLVG